MDSDDRNGILAFLVLWAVFAGAVCFLIGIGMWIGYGIWG